MVRIQQTIVVGVGSLGRAAVEHLKRRIGAVHGELPAIRLFAFDVSSNDQGEARSTEIPPVLGPTELLELPLAEALRAIQADGSHLYPWLPDRLLQEVAEEQRQTRAAARLALHIYVPETFRFLEDALQRLGTAEVQEAMNAKGFEVASELDSASLVVVAGLGEVAGSALFLDVAYLIQHLYQRLNLQTASTGILFMPPMAPSDPGAEACAYAALKELNRCTDRGGYHCEYQGMTVESDSEPFNRGCYLVDVRNERNLTLGTQTEASKLVGEWLFRTLLTPLKARIDDFVSEHISMVSIRRQPAAYSSLGLTAQILPVEDLIEWSANRLAHDLLMDQLLKPAMFGEVSKRLSDFFSSTSLRPDAMIDKRLKPDERGTWIQLRDERVQQLRTVPYMEIVPKTQQMLNQIGKMIPDLKRQIENNSRRVPQDLEERISQEITAILRGEPAGNISLASQFCERLRQETIRFSEALKRREAASSARNQQLANHLTQLGPALKSAVASIPSTPVVIGAFAGGLLAPLILTLTWLAQSSSELSLPIGIVLMAVVVSAVAYTISRTRRGVDFVRDQYVSHLTNRFNAELDLARVGAAAMVYSSITHIIDEQLGRLKGFIVELTELARILRARLGTDALCGSVEFTLQHSVLTPELIESLYARFLGAGHETRLRQLIEQAGALDTWQDSSKEEILDRLLGFSRGVFAPMRELRIEDQLKPQLEVQTKADILIRRFQNEAAPLWIYDRFGMGEAYAAEARSFITMNSPGESEFRKRYSLADPTAVFEATDDRQSLVNSTVRSRIPLFAVQRVGGFKANYLAHLRRRGRPLHIDDEMALSPDLAGVDSSSTDLDDPTAVALARAFGWLKQGNDKVFTLSLPDSKRSAPHTDDLIDSTILLNSDRRLMAELSRCIQNRLSEKGAAEGVTFLETYLNKTAVSDWERKRLERFVSVLRG